MTAVNYTHFACKILEKELYKCNSYHNKYSENNVANFEKKKK